MPPPPPATIHRLSTHFNTLWPFLWVCVGVLCNCYVITFTWICDFKSFSLFPLFSFIFLFFVIVAFLWLIFFATFTLSVVTRHCSLFIELLFNCAISVLFHWHRLHLFLVCVCVYVVHSHIKSNINGCWAGRLVLLYTLTYAIFSSFSGFCCWSCCYRCWRFDYNAISCPFLNLMYSNQNSARLFSSGVWLRIQESHCIVRLVSVE